MNGSNLFRLISSLALIILIPVVGNRVTPASHAYAPHPTPSSAPPPATPIPAGTPTPPFLVDFTQTQPNPYWQTYSRSDGVQEYVTALLIDQAGRKWIGGVGGLTVFDGRTWLRYTSANGLLTDYVTALAQDLAGNIWVGYSGSGLSRFDGQTWQHYTLAPDMVGNSVHNLAVDQTGRLWFSAGQSLGMFDGQSWAIYQASPPLSGIPSPPLEPPANAPLIKPQLIEIGPDHPNYSGLSDITVDAAGQVWLFTRNGPSKFDGRQWSNYPLDIDYFGSHMAVNSAAREIWLASNSHGVSRLTLPVPSETTSSHSQGLGDLNWSHYNQLNGLPRDSVEAIAIDPAGRVWFGTSAGATIFDGQTWQTYTQADGLPPRTIMSIAVDPAGHVWLVTSTGALAEFTPPASPAPLPAPVSEVVPRLLDFTLTPTTALTVGDVISITWQAVGEQAEFCLFSGRPVYCQPEPISGSRVITVDEALLTEAISGVWLNVTAAGQSTGIFGELKFQCRYAWFFDSASVGCPEAPPVYARGAAQYFERGLMIWTEQPDRFYVFFDQDHQMAWFDAGWVKESSFLATPEPLPTPAGVIPTPAPWPTTPPPGAVEPVSGFGRIWQYYWRYENNLPVMVRQDIGWATGPEFAFETATQCALGTAAYHTWTCYVRSPTGAVLSYAPQSTIRDRWVWQEKTPGLSSCESHFSTTTDSVDAVFNQGQLLYLNIGPFLAILNLADAPCPKLIGTIELPVNSVSDITVANGYAYVAANEAGLRIVDVSDPAHLTEVGVYQPPLAGLAQWEGPAPYGPDTPHFLYAQGARSVAVESVSGGSVLAYVAAQGAGLRIVDVTNPAAPVEIGVYQTPGDAVDVAVVNGLAYVAAFEAGLRIIDVSQPATPAEIGSLVQPDEGWFLGVTPADHSVYLGGGHCSNEFGCSGFVKRVDVSNPATPAVIWRKTDGPTTHIINAENYAYAVGWLLASIDLIDPAQPVFYITSISDYGYSSAYEANVIKQAAATTGYLYLAAGEAGLRMVDVSDPANPVEVHAFFTPQQ